MNSALFSLCLSVRLSLRPSVTSQHMLVRHSARPTTTASNTHLTSFFHAPPPPRTTTHALVANTSNAVASVCLLFTPSLKNDRLTSSSTSLFPFCYVHNDSHCVSTSQKSRLLPIRQVTTGKRCRITLGLLLMESFSRLLFIRCSLMQ